MMTEKDNSLCSSSGIPIMKGEKVVQIVFILCAINSS